MGRRHGVHLRGATDLRHHDSVSVGYLSSEDITSLVPTLQSDLQGSASFLQVDCSRSKGCARVVSICNGAIVGFNRADGWD